MTHLPARLARPLSAAAALVLAAVPVCARAAAPADEPDPAIELADSHLSGAVGGVGDQTAQLTVAQDGTAPADLAVAATKSSEDSVADTGDVTVSGTGATRQVSVTAHRTGYTDITLRVTGSGGRQATAKLHFAASASVRDPADTRYFSGAADASAAVDVGDGYAVVADDESDTLRLYDRNAGGAPVRSWDLDSALGTGKEADIEAGARVGDTIYWTGSMSNDKDGDPSPDRSTLFTTEVTGSGAATQLAVGGVYRGLRQDLVDWDRANGDRYGFAAGAADGQVPKEIDGFNVEGMEFAPGSTSTAYIGFRAPLVPPADGGKALLVPVTNVDELASGDAAHAAFGTPVTLDLGGLSVRDIRRNSAGQYLIVAGSWAADDNSTPYALYRWDGAPGDAPAKLLDLPTDDQGAWESVVDVPDLTAPGARAQLLTDDGDDDLYGDGTLAKDLDHAGWQKDRAVWFTVNQ